MSHLLRFELPRIAIESLENLSDNRLLHIVDLFHRQLVAPKQLPNHRKRLERLPVGAGKPRISEVFRKSQAIIHEIQYCSQSLLSIDHMIGRLTVVRVGDVQEDCRTRVVANYCIKKALLLSEAPDAPALIWRLQVKLTKTPQVQQPSNRLKRWHSIHRALDA